MFNEAQGTMLPGKLIMKEWEKITFSSTLQEINGISPVAAKVPEEAVILMEEVLMDKSNPTLADKVQCVTAVDPQIPEITVKNFLDHCMQIRVKEQVRKLHARSHRFYLRYLSKIKGGTDCYRSIIEMGKQDVLPPSLLARFVLQEYIRINGLRSENISLKAEREDGAKSNSMRDGLKRKELDKVLLEEPGLIRDSQMRTAVTGAVCEDEWAGPTHDTDRFYLGHMYEQMLYSALHARRVAFINEEVQRHQQAMKRSGGKTPDVLFMDEIRLNGKQVRWIDSKALFCSQSMHDEIVDKQLSGYCKRFGPGLVIYWLGHVSGLRTSCPDVQVSYSLPELLRRKCDSQHAPTDAAYRRALQAALTDLVSSADAGQVHAED